MITVTKSKYHEYLEYHTSLDNLDFISPTNILKSLNAYDKILNELENDFWPQRTQKTPGEFQLGKHNLYPKIGGKLNTKSPGAEEAVESYSILDAYMWVMFYSDGHTPLKFIADRSGINLSLLRRACFDLASKGLITL
jgi:aminopeptidase-like protein